MSCDTKNKIAIFMTNISDYEYYREFKDIKNYQNVDWYYFTDKNIESTFWKIYNINKLDAIIGKNIDSRLLTKHIKMNTHKILPDYDYYLYIDASFEINNLNLIDDINNFIKNDFNLVLFIHPRQKERNTHKEYKRCRETFKKYVIKFDEQITFYREEKFNINKKDSLYATGIIFKKNIDKINNMMELWFEQNKKYSTRDQISLPYVLWKSNIEPSKVIHQHIFNNILVGIYIRKERPLDV